MLSVRNILFQQGHVWINSLCRFAHSFHLSSIYKVFTLGRTKDIVYFSELLPGLPSVLSQGHIGRLGIKIEPAGKVRVFAMVDAFSQ